VPGLLIFQGNFARLNEERQRGSHSATQQEEHNRIEIHETKRASQLREKVGGAALVKNQKTMLAQVHIQYRRNRTSVNSREQ